MTTAGIVAEFNPFHKGHEYLIAEARSKGATHIVCCMSGAAVQRGELAIADKHSRAAAAVRGGADLVVELPAPFSCSCAEVFAKYAVRTLLKLGTDVLAFGSEYDDAAVLKKAAETSLWLPDNELTHRLEAEGMTYPAAIAEAARQLAGKETAAVLSSPNSTLAVEYINALQAKADIMPIKRIGAAHDSSEESDFSSGMELRRRMLSGEEHGAFEPVDPTKAESVIYYELLSAGRERLSKLPELGEPLGNRIIKLSAQPPATLNEFLLAVKNKSCTLARLRRSALQLTIGVEGSEDVIPEPPFIRILAMNERGTQILRRAQPDIPVSTSLSTLAASSERAARIIDTENRAVKLMQLCSGRFENEFTRKITVMK